MRVAWAAAADATDLDTEGPLLRAAARRLGLDEHVAVWDDPSVDWAGYDLVVIRATWDYFRRPADFLAWCTEVAAVTDLCNDLEVVRWNHDKRYLGELADAGLPVVPTSFHEHPSAPPVIGDGEWVVKPTVSAGSNDTFRVSSAADVAAATERLTADGRVAMLQPYIASVDQRGERGVVTVDGRISHTFFKGPLLEPDGAADVDGLFAREHIEPAIPTDAERSVAERTLEWIAARFGPQLYARIDLVDDADGRPQILEVELIEPGLFFQVDPPAADRFAEAVARRSGS